MGPYKYTLKQVCHTPFPLFCFFFFFNKHCCPGIFGIKAVYAKETELHCRNNVVLLYFILGSLSEMD